jgi:hypothetical protein
MIDEENEEESKEPVRRATGPFYAPNLEAEREKSPLRCSTAGNDSVTSHDATSVVRSSRGARPTVLAGSANAYAIPQPQPGAIRMFGSIAVDDDNVTVTDATYMTPQSATPRFPHTVTTAQLVPEVQLATIVGTGGDSHVEENVDDSSVEDQSKGEAGKKKRNVLVIGAVIVAIAAVAIGVVVTVLLSGGDEDPLPTSAPTPEPTVITIINSTNTGITPLEGVWRQMGQNVEGQASNDRFGHSIALSADGGIMAVAGSRNDNNGVDSGHVRVYQWVSKEWVQIADISGETAGDNFGASISLSEDGLTLAVGAIWNDGNGSNSGHARVYNLVGVLWNQVGSDIDGDSEDDWSGAAVSLSADGGVLAVGAYLNEGIGSNSGQVRVYRLEDGDWTQVGSDLVGEKEFDYFGVSVSLSAGGELLAVGATGNDRFTSGHVRVFRLENGDWVQVGPNIEGENGGDNFGTSTSLSGDGNFLAVGAWFNDDNGSNSGHARVYQLADETSWIQAGSDIVGQATGDQFGVSVSLSEDGNVLAVGADESSNGSGEVRIFQYFNGDWVQVGESINGNGAGDELGVAVALSADGKTMAAGAWQDLKEGDSPGYATVYRLEQ